MRLIVLILLVIVQHISSAQTFRVAKFAPKLSDVSARTKLRFDSEGKECALVKVLLAKKGATFQNAVGDVDNRTNEYYVYLSPGTQNLFIIIDSNALNITFADYGVNNVESKTTYEMVIVNEYGRKFSSTNVPADFISLAENGDAEAECNLGKCHYFGQGTPQNYYVALTWFRKSAEKGWAESQYYIGKCYYYGQGFPKPDYVQAFIWYQKAAEQNHAEAQYQLALCYEKGHGIKKDLISARNWYERAAANGNKKAKHKIQ